MNRKTNGPSRILDFLYYRTAICIGVALFITIVAAVPLGAIVFHGHDTILFGWSPKAGPNVSSLKAVVFTILVVAVFSSVYCAAQGISEEYIRTKTRAKGD
jgi:hypothetical protein